MTDVGLDKKILLRSDGTAVYMTQDVGTAILRHQEFAFDQMIYTVGNEQNYHFDVLFKILDKMGLEWSSNLFHLSYGMVSLPEGKMKSREVKPRQKVTKMSQTLSKRVKKVQDLLK